MIAELVPFHWRFRLLERGERGVAFLGIALALILVVCFTANAWLTDRANKESAANQRLATMTAIGPVLSERSQRLLAAGDLAGLRQLTATVGRALRLNACTVSIGSGRVLADISPAGVNVFELPDHWTVDASEEAPVNANSGTRLRFPFAVPGKGAGFLDLEASTAAAKDDSNFGPSALVCAFGLCLLVFVYRRSRRGLAEMEIISSSLSAIDRGETSSTALKVDATLGPIAAAWNKLLSEVDELRQRGTANQAVVAIGNRRRRK